MNTVKVWKHSEQSQLTGPPAARLKGMTSWQYLFSSKKSYLFIRKSVNQRQLRQSNQRNWEENPKKNFFLEDEPCQNPGNPVAASVTVLKSSLSKRKRTTHVRTTGSSWYLHSALESVDGKVITSGPAEVVVLGGAVVVTTGGGRPGQV